jgi:hypothetical protein
VKEEERRKKRATHQAEEKSSKTNGAVALERHRSLQSSGRGKSPEASNTGHTTVSSSATDKASSWGKKRGGLFRNGRQLTSIGLTHGPFSFEPAVPSSPTWSVASAPNSRDAPLVVSWGGEKGRTPKEKERERSKASQALERGRAREKEQEKEREREKQKRAQSTTVGDRAPVPVPNPVPVGHRSGLKGRSLDLGIGLAWAPATVREEALLPSSAFFARSMSGGSLAGHSTSTRGGTETIEEAGERSGIGREVAEVFKNALDSTGYATFKKCMSSLLFFFLIVSSQTAYSR